jgi:hypothetical protein
MDIKLYFKSIILLLTGSVLLQNCGPDDAPADYCDKHWTLNQDYLENLLFDYENTDTLLYKRTINNVVTDTLMFVKQRSYQDVLLFSNNAGAGDPACGSSRREFTREVMGWDYSSQYDSIFFNVQVVASGEDGKGFDVVDIRILDTLFITYDFFRIGNYGINYETNYTTSEGVYSYCWGGGAWNIIKYSTSGTVEQHGLRRRDWDSYYNIDHGIIEIFKIDRTEVWELIP